MRVTPPLCDSAPRSPNARVVRRHPLMHAGDCSPLVSIARKVDPIPRLTRREFLARSWPVLAVGLVSACDPWPRGITVPPDEAAYASAFQSDAFQ